MPRFKIVTIYHLVRSCLLNRELIRYARCIVENEALNHSFYKSQRPRNLAAQLNPVAHYILWGESQGLWPNPDFSPRDYINNNPKHAHEIKQPLWHFIEHGRFLRLTTTPLPADPSKLLADLKLALSQASTRPFTQEIILRDDITGKNRKNVIFFSHYDAHSIIDDHVVYSIKYLSRYADIVFISTSEFLPRDSVICIKEYCRTIIIKKNVGYDFGAWKTGMDAISNDLDRYDNLVLCNDSVYGPFFPLDDFFDEMDKGKCDVFSMTKSHDIIEHTQSYFTVFNKKAFSSEIFNNFWSNFVIIEDKKSLILSHEVLFSNSLIRSELNVGSYVQSQKNIQLNATHFDWKKLILENGFPFLKVELLRDNPMKIDISGWKEIISSVSSYNTDLIENHLERMRSKDSSKLDDLVDFFRKTFRRIFRKRDYSIVADTL